MHRAHRTLKVGEELTVGGVDLKIEKVGHHKVTISVAVRRPEFTRDEGTGKTSLSFLPVSQSLPAAPANHKAD